MDMLCSLRLAAIVAAGSSLLLVCVCAARGESAVLLDDDFSAMPAGPMLSPIGAHAEYHYVPELAPKGNWAVSCFTTDTAAQTAWRVERDAGRSVMVQGYRNGGRRDSHPMIISGDELWADYTVAVQFAPETGDGQSGIAFRYRNDRCYYFAGVSGPRAILKMVRHEAAFHQPFEKVLAEAKCPWNPGEMLTLTATAAGNRLRVEVAGAVLEAEDATYPRGKIGLTSDVPTRYSHVRVTMPAAEKAQFEARSSARAKEEADLQAANPRPVVWRKFETPGFGVGRNLRFGDLDGDGRTDLLIGQVVHHGPKDSYSELSCLTAMTFDGKILWQLGTPDPSHDNLTNDVAFQIHDIDGDGRNEVIYCMNLEIIVADGATGRTKYKAPTPATDRKGAKYPRILGDCLFFCDLRGTGRPRDIIIKDRYWNLWALNDRLEEMWHGECTTGHYPWAADIDGDGKDEVLMGYSLFDHDGRKLWSLDGVLKDHADGVAIVKFREDLEPRILCAASDEGILLIDLRGRILKHQRLGHVQNPAVANFRDDLPGLEAVSINFWGNQGIVHFFDAEQAVYHDFEPNQHGSMCLPVNWTGRSEEFFVHNANVKEGGIFDGRGRRAVIFPDDGHPDMCNAVLDLVGDCRDEIVVWDTRRIWVYTQSDGPRTGRLYKPRRNPLYNYSNYQATVSLPGWSE
jgi:hypothetical protein